MYDSWLGAQTTIIHSPEGFSIKGDLCIDLHHHLLFRGAKLFQTTYVKEGPLPVLALSPPGVTFLQPLRPRNLCMRWASTKAHCMLSAPTYKTIICSQSS